MRGLYNNLLYFKLIVGECINIIFSLCKCKGIGECYYIK